MPRQPKRGTLAGERGRGTAPRDTESPRTPPAADSATAASRREVARICAWCGGAIATKPRGRIPKWCSSACRQRAWEQTRAAASGHSAVQVVERVVQVPVERDHVPRHGEWPAVLAQLTAQLDSGRVYARDLPDLSAALTELLAAYHRHPGVHRPPRR